MQKREKKDLKTAFVTNLFVVVITATAIFCGSGYLLIPVDNLILPLIFSLDASETIVDMLYVSYYLVTYAVPMAICILYMAVTRKQTLKTLWAGFGNNNAGTFFGGMLAGFLLNGFLVMLGICAGNLRISYSEFLLLPLLAVLAGGVVQCSCEEIIHRGYVYQYLKHRYGAALAVLTGGITFVLTHISNLMTYGFELGFVLNIILIGVIFALVMRRTGSFWFACGMHTMWNFTQQYLFGLPNSGFVSLGAVFVAEEAKDGFFFHTTFGIEGAWGCTVVLSLVTLLLLILEKKRPVANPEQYGHTEIIS